MIHMLRLCPFNGVIVVASPLGTVNSPSMDSGHIYSIRHVFPPVK